MHTSRSLNNTPHHHLHYHLPFFQANHTSTLPPTHPFPTNTPINAATTATLSGVIRGVAAAVISVHPEVKGVGVVRAQRLGHGDHAHRNALLQQTLGVRVHQLRLTPPRLAHSFRLVEQLHARRLQLGVHDLLRRQQMVARLPSAHLLALSLLAHRVPGRRCDQIRRETAHVDHLVRDVVHELHQQLTLTHASQHHVDVVHHGAGALAGRAALEARATADGAGATTHAVAEGTGLAAVVSHSPARTVAGGAGVAAAAVAGCALHMAATETAVALLHVLRVRDLDVYRLLGEHGGNGHGNVPRQGRGAVVGGINLRMKGDEETNGLAVVGTLLVARGALLHVRLPHAVIGVHGSDARDRHGGGRLLAPAAIRGHQLLEGFAQILVANVRAIHLIRLNNLAL